MKMNVLLTGGAGYIGSNVANLLIDRGHNVTIIDSLETGHKKLIPKKAKLIISDISNIKKIKDNLDLRNFDLAIHFAGLISVDESMKNPIKYNLYNYKKTKIFLNFCFKNGLKNIIFSSSASVYGNPKKKKVTEKDKLNPLNPYAKSKLKVENFLINKSKKFPIKYVILRYFNVAGADIKMRSGLVSKKSSHLIKVACEVALGKRKKLIINGDDYDTPDGTPVRDYIHINDLAEIHIKSAKDLIKKRRSNIFNCGYGKGFSVKEVIFCFNKLLNKNLYYEIGPRRPSDSKYVVANSKKFNDYFSWKPKYNNLKLILETSLKWEKKIKNKKFNL